MKRKSLSIRITLIALAAIIAFAAYFAISFTLPVYTYESSDKGFTDVEIPSKGRTLKMVEGNFQIYKYGQNNPELTLYRTSRRIWNAPNLWVDNFTNKRWGIPYSDSSPPLDGDDNLYLYKVMTKIDGIIKPRTTLEHDYHINLFSSKRDDIDPRSQIVISKFGTVTSIPYIKKGREWQHSFTISIDPSMVDIPIWKNKNRVTTGCLVYRNKIVGMVFFGPQWKENALNVYIAADEEGMSYLKSILMKKQK